MEMQSSPVMNTLPVILTPEEDSMWIPSVMGLLLGARIRDFWITTLVEWSMAMFIIWLLIEVNPLITKLLHHMMEIDCNTSNVRIDVNIINFLSFVRN